MRIILASSSVRRAKIMDTLVKRFEIIVPDIDEKAFPRSCPLGVTAAVAIAKGRAVAERLSEPAIIVAADTVAYVPGEGIREKPVDKRQARKWLRSYRDVHPECYTTIYSLRTTDAHDRLDGVKATIAFHPFTEERIDAILVDGTAMGCAGAFTMEHPLFADLVYRVIGDPECIQGLPGEVVLGHLADLL